MKMISKIAIVFLLGIVNVFAASAPPTPASTAKSAAALGPDPQPDLPIDSNLLLLAIAALLLGIYVIYKHKLNKKASV
jgi:hypothetical protein